MYHLCRKRKNFITIYKFFHKIRPRKYCTFPCFYSIVPAFHLLFIILNTNVVPYFKLFFLNSKKVNQNFNNFKICTNRSQTSHCTTARNDNVHAHVHASSLTSDHDWPESFSKVVGTLEIFHYKSTCIVV